VGYGTDSRLDIFPTAWDLPLSLYIVHPMSSLAFSTSQHTNNSRFSGHTTGGSFVQTFIHTKVGTPSVMNMTVIMNVNMSISINMSVNLNINMSIRA
jgi:hypothetical protein